MKKLLTLFLCLPLWLPLQAQTRLDSLLYRHALQPITLWESTWNPATLSAAALPDYGVATAFATGSSGRFRRVQEAETDWQGGLYAEGMRHMGGWSYYGDFSYGKRWQQELRWTGTNDPLSGNPFTWADSLGGDWAKDFLEANLQVSSPALMNRLSAGIGVNYRIGQGARTLDPKPFFRSRVLSLRPGLSYQLTERALLGAFAEVGYTFEEQEMGFYTGESALVYRIRGAGTFSRTPLVTAERQTTGHNHTAGLQYALNRNNKQLLLSAQVQQRQEEVQEKAMQPLPAGTFKELSAMATADFSRQREQGLFFVNLAYTFTDSQGTDPVFFTANALHTLHTLAGAVGVAVGQLAPTAPARGLSLHPHFSQRSTTDRTARVNYDITRAGASLQGHARFQMFQRLVLSLQPEIGYSHVPISSYEAARDNIIVRQLTTPDYEVLSANYWQAGLQSHLDVPFKQKNRVRVALGMQHLQAAVDLGARTSWNGGISFYY